MPTRQIARYGWRRDLPDHRDFKMAATKPVVLPTRVDLSTSACMPPVYDQGDIGSCTANAIAAAVDFERACQGKPFITPSRLFIYYNERAIEGDTANDSGAQIRDGIKVVAASGAPPESEWPYNPSEFAEAPTAEVVKDAMQFRALQYSRVTQDAYYLRHCLAILGKPVVFGFTVYDGFESDDAAKTGIIPMPLGDDKPLGGHAVLIVGYDDATQMFKVRNSWGADWGQAGYFELPYAYVLNADLSDDFWTILLES